MSEQEPRAADIALMLENEMDKRIIGALIRMLSPESPLDAEKILAMSNDEASDKLVELLDRAKKAAARRREIEEKERMAQIFAQAMRNRLHPAVDPANLFGEYNAPTIHDKGTDTVVVRRPSNYAMSAPVEGLGVSGKTKGLPGGYAHPKEKTVIERILRWVRN